MFHTTCGRNYPVVINCCSTKKEWETQNLCRFEKVDAATKKDLFPLPFTYEVFNTMARCETYSFMDGYFGYRQIL
jgi:hypothetical protein